MLLNGKNKRNEIFFSRLTRWIDRLIPFDFRIEHKPGAKIGLEDFLSRNPSSLAEPVYQYDSMFTVAKMHSICKSFGFAKTNLFGGPDVKHQYASSKPFLGHKNIIRKFRTTKRLLEGDVACGNGS